MSNYIPPFKVQQEFISQSVRRATGLKTGAYVRAKNDKGQVGTLTKNAAAKQGLTIITEAEFQAIINPKKADQVTDTGTSEVKSE